MIGYHQVVISIDLQILQVTCSPRDYLIMQAETLALSVPSVNGGFGRFVLPLSMIGDCKEKLQMK